MMSLREALATVAHAGRIGLPSPVSLRDLILASDVKIFERIIVTPPGTALGGHLKLVVRGDGLFVFSGHMHNSGFDSYRFTVQAFLRGEQIGLG